MSPIGSVLRNSRARPYFAGLFISSCGLWMQLAAQSWLVYRLTGSGWWLGFVSLCSEGTAFLLSPFAGSLVDRSERRRVLIATSWVLAIQAFALAGLSFAGKITPAWIAALAIVHGAAKAFEMTGRHVFVSDLVPGEELGGALALNSTVINASRIVGPGLAGAILAATGESWCFLINALSFGAVLYGLYHVPKSVVAEAGGASGGVLRSIGQGMGYLAGHALGRRIILATAILAGLAAVPHVLLPILADRGVGGGARAYTWMIAVEALGAVTGALFVGMSGRPAALRPVITRNIALLGASIVVLGISRSVFVSAAMCFVMGAALLNCWPRMNHALQRSVSPAIRGRVLSLYTMTFLGVAPLSGFAAGWAADKAGPGVVLGIVGISGLTGSLALAARASRKGPSAVRTLVEGAPAAAARPAEH